MALAAVCLDTPALDGYRWAVVATLAANEQSHTGEGPDAWAYDLSGATGVTRPCQPVLFRDAAGVEAGTYSWQVTELLGSWHEGNPPERLSIPGPWSFEIAAGP
jgi:hypothetical protein